MGKENIRIKKYTPILGWFTLINKWNLDFIVDVDFKNGRFSGYDAGFNYSKIIIFSTDLNFLINTNKEAMDKELTFNNYNIEVYE